MARSVRDARLDSREARLKLKRGVRHFRGIGDGVALCYRRKSASYGTWSVRLRGADGKYALRSLEASADDHEDSNGVDVLSFFQAQDRAREEAKRWRTETGRIAAPLTVTKAVERYLAWFRKSRKSVRETEAAINTHILPSLGERLVSKLTTPELRDWLEQLAAQPARIRTSRYAEKANRKPAPKTENEKRARRATANRVLNVMKAILNRAFADELVDDDTAWRRVKPFPKADEARIRFLTDAEAGRLVNACPAGLRELVRAALLTGARFGEIAGMHVRDVNLDAGRVYITPSKGGRSRHVPLNAEGVALFKELLTGKTGEAPLFTKADGAPWGQNHHVRALKEACRVAKVRPMVSFHELRHTYASHLAQAGVPILTISKLLGHASTRITEKHYAHLCDATLAQAVEHLPSFSGSGATALAAVDSPPQAKAHTT